MFSFLTRDADCRGGGGGFSKFLGVFLGIICGGGVVRGGRIGGSR